MGHKGILVLDPSLGLHGPSPREVVKSSSWAYFLVLLFSFMCLVKSVRLAICHCLLVKSTYMNELAKIKGDDAAAELQRHHLKKRRRLICTIMLMIPFFNAGYFAPLLVPHARFLFELLHHVAEGVALSSFLVLLLDLLGGAHRAERVLEAQPPQRYLAVPPLGICFLCCPCIPLPCCKPIPWTRRLMRVARIAAEQFKIVVPALGVLTLYFQLQEIEVIESLEKAHDLDGQRRVAEMTETILTSLEIAEKVSMFTCVYGLFILYSGTHEILHHYSPSRMFWTLKGPLTVSMLQRYFLLWLHVEPSFVFNGSLHMDEAQRVFVLNSFLGSVEMTLVCWGATLAYPISLIAAPVHVDNDIHDSPASDSCKGKGNEECLEGRGVSAQEVELGMWHI